MKIVREYGHVSDKPALEIARHVVSLLEVFEREAPGKIIKPSDKYFKYVVENSRDSGIGGHFDCYLWTRNSPEVDFRFVAKTTVLSDLGSRLIRRGEASSAGRLRWLQTFEDWNGKIEFDYDNREFEAVLSSYMTATDSARLGEALNTFYASILFKN